MGQPQGLDAQSYLIESGYHLDKDKSVRTRSHDAFQSPKKLKESQRGRKCLIVLKIPNSTASFKCDLPTGHEGDHREQGLVTPKRGSTQGYTISWKETISITWRQE